jgi:hypothetical protein
MSFRKRKEIHSQRLGVNYTVIIRKYNNYVGGKNAVLEHAMSPTYKNDKTFEIKRPYYIARRSK